MFDRLKEIYSRLRTATRRQPRPYKYCFYTLGLRPSECIEELTGVGTTI